MRKEAKDLEERRFQAFKSCTEEFLRKRGELRGKNSTDMTTIQIVTN
jgi:hypothetical protein